MSSFKHAGDERDFKRIKNEASFQALVDWLATVDQSRPSSWDYELEKRVTAIFVEHAERILNDEKKVQRADGYDFGYRHGYKHGYDAGEEQGEKTGITRIKQTVAGLS